MGIGGADMATFRSIVQFDKENELVNALSDKTIESLNNIEHGGIDIIKREVTTQVDSVDFEWVYSNIWDKVFRHVLVKLENKHQLAHVLMK